MVCSLVFQVGRFCRRRGWFDPVLQLTFAQSIDMIERFDIADFLSCQCLFAAMKSLCVAFPTMKNG